MIHHFLENSIFYNFCMKFFHEIFSTKKLNSAWESYQLLENTKKPEKRIAYQPSSFGCCSLNFRARLMYDTSFCHKFYTLQLLYEGFSTQMLNSASELFQLLENTKKPEKPRFHHLVFDAVDSILDLGQCMIHHFIGNLYALPLLYETFSTKVRSTQDPLKKLFGRAPQGGRDLGRSVCRRFYIP